MFPITQNQTYKKKNMWATIFGSFFFTFFKFRQIKKMGKKEGEYVL